MGTAVIFLGVYLALAVLFYARLTATATDGRALQVPKPLRWHRARHLTAAFLRRVRSGTRKS